MRDTPTNPENPQDQVTDILRKVVAREAEASRRSAPAPTRVRYLGDYELVEEIARGGMGVVYRARQLTLKRDVALKMILAGELADEQAVERFHVEAEAAANLKHPNIVGIHEVGQHEGQHYFSMELVEGSTLAEMIREEPLSSRRAATYVRIIAEAIQYAHDQGTLHRDIKPSNVLIDREDRPRITDFGLARSMEDSPGYTQSGAVLGTPGYMPPEQASGTRGQVGPASDVYSLGALLYALLTGRPPFQSDNPVDTLIQVIENDPASPRVVNPGVPVALETICLKCLEKRPEARYSSAQALAEDLQRFLDREPILAAPTGSLQRATAWVRKRPWLVAGIFSLLTLALAGVACWLWAERSLLRYQILNPEYVRESGPRTAWLQQLIESKVWFSTFALIAFYYVYTDTAGFRWIRRRPGALFTVGALGVLVLLYGATMLVATTNAFVWEANDPGYGAIASMVAIVISTHLILRTYYGYEGLKSGARLDLSWDQRDQLEELLSEGSKSEFPARLQAGTKLYLEWTGADPIHAKQALQQLWRDLHIAFPDSVPPQLTTALRFRFFLWVAFILFIVFLF